MIVINDVFLYRSDDSRIETNIKKHNFHIKDNSGNLIKVMETERVKGI